jgi:hypothetical protein
VGGPVHVALQVRYHWLKYLTRRVSLGTTTLTGSATMRLESKPYTGVSLTVPACYPNNPAGT